MIIQIHNITWLSSLVKGRCWSFLLIPRNKLKSRGCLHRWLGGPFGSRIHCSVGRKIRLHEALHKAWESLPPWSWLCVLHKAFSSGAKACVCSRTIYFLSKRYNSSKVMFLSSGTWLCLWRLLTWGAHTWPSKLSWLSFLALAVIWCPALVDPGRQQCQLQETIRFLSLMWDIWIEFIPPKTCVLSR